MVIRDKIYNMMNENQDPTQNSPEQYGYPHDPELVAGSLETLIANLATPEQLRNGFDWMQERQTELYDRSRKLRAQGKQLPAREAEELDELHTGMLTIQSLFEKYHPTE